MKIEIAESNYKFKDIPVGEIFEHCESIYIKTSGNQQEENNAFNLTIDTNSWVDKDTPIKVLDAKLVIIS